MAGKLPLFRTDSQVHNQLLQGRSHIIFLDIEMPELVGGMDCLAGGRIRTVGIRIVGAGVRYLLGASTLFGRV